MASAAIICASCGAKRRAATRDALPRGCWPHRIAPLPSGTPNLRTARRCGSAEARALAPSTDTGAGQVRDGDSRDGVRGRAELPARRSRPDEFESEAPRSNDEAAAGDENRGSRGKFSRRGGTSRVGRGPYVKDGGSRERWSPAWASSKSKRGADRGNSGRLLHSKSSYLSASPDFQPQSVRSPTYTSDGR